MKRLSIEGSDSVVNRTFDSQMEAVNKSFQIIWCFKSIYSLKSHGGR